MNGEQNYDEYCEATRDIEARNGVEMAFMLGQLSTDPALIFAAEIAYKEQEILDAEEAGDSGKLCVLNYELHYLKMVQIETQGVYRNVHSEATDE